MILKVFYDHLALKKWHDTRRMRHLLSCSSCCSSPWNRKARDISGSEVTVEQSFSTPHEHDCSGEAMRVCWIKLRHFCSRLFPRAQVKVSKIFFYAHKRFVSLNFWSVHWSWSSSMYVWMFISLSHLQLCFKESDSYPHTRRQRAITPATWYNTFFTTKEFMHKFNRNNITEARLWVSWTWLQFLGVNRLERANAHLWCRLALWRWFPVCTVVDRWQTRVWCHAPPPKEYAYVLALYSHGSVSFKIKLHTESWRYYGRNGYCLGFVSHMIASKMLDAFGATSYHWL